MLYFTIQSNKHEPTKNKQAKIQAYSKFMDVLFSCKVVFSCNICFQIANFKYIVFFYSFFLTPHICICVYSLHSNNVKSVNDEFKNFAKQDGFTKLKKEWKKKWNKPRAREVVKYSDFNFASHESEIISFFLFCSFEYCKYCVGS